MVMMMTMMMVMAQYIESTLPSKGDSKKTVITRCVKRTRKLQKDVNTSLTVYRSI